MLLTFYVTTFAIVYTSTLGLMTFTSANRSTPVRWAVFAQTVAYVGWMGSGIATSPAAIPREMLLRGYIVAVVYWFAAGAVMCGERPTLSLRVRRSLPQSLLGRAIGTWFQPGGASGYMFATVNLFGLGFLTAAAGYLRATGSPSDNELAFGAFLLWSYTAIYLGVGRLVVIGLRKVTELSLLATFLIQALVALACSGFPYVVDTLTDRIRVADAVWINAVSGPWNVSQLLDGRLSIERQITLGVAVGAVALTMWLINAVMAGHEARRLRVRAATAPHRGRPRAVAQARTRANQPVGRPARLRQRGPQPGRRGVSRAVRSGPATRLSRSSACGHASARRGAGQSAARRPPSPTPLRGSPEPRRRSREPRMARRPLQSRAVPPTRTCCPGNGRAALEDGCGALNGSWRSGNGGS